MGAIGDWFARAFISSDSDQQSGAQYNATYNANQRASADSTGNLTDEEAKSGSASRAFRIGTFFTSPTGVLNTAKRRGTKLLGG
jgi:hypothetical protein